MIDDGDHTSTNLLSATAAPPADGAAAARLVALDGDEVGRRYDIDRDVVLGRGSDADVRVEHPDISRRHARIRRTEAGEYVLKDLGSRNGTLVNGETVTERVIAFGDRVQLGARVTFLFTHADPAEEHVLRRQKLEAIGHLGAGIAHDFNNLLGAVSACLDYLEALPRTRGLGEADVQECFDDIRTATARAAEMTRQLLSFARRGVAPQELVNLTMLAAEVIGLLRRLFARTVRIESDISPGVVVRGDRTQLHQLLMNLCINARDAMPRGGLLAVRLELVAAPETTAESGEDVPGDQVLLTVRDSGVGMDAPTRERVFEPFFTTKAAGLGTGLGLTTVHDVATWHGGRVEVDSQPGSGTTFRVWLPAIAARTVDETQRATQKARYVTVPPSSALGSSAPRWVLVVDDDDVVRRSTGRLLVQAGYAVCYARDGREGVDAYRHHDPRPEVVVLDLDMPELGGEAAFDELRTMDPGARVIFASGYCEEARETRLRARGACGVLTKPFDAAALRAAVARALAEAPDAPPSEP